jgi:hypothetical protein
MNNHGDDKPLQEPVLTKEARNTQFLRLFKKTVCQKNYFDIPVDNRLAGT